MSALKESSDPSIKKCFKCGGEFPLTNFYKNSVMADGHLNKCKECAKKDVKANYRKNKDHYKNYDKWRYENNPDRKKALVEYRESDHGKEVLARLKKGWIERNPEKHKAHVALGNAVRDGKVLKPDSCSVCSKTDCQIEGHHADYSKPLEVTWVCSKCHSDLHK